MNSLLLAAMRQASVAISRERVTARRPIFSAHTLSASMVRLMAASDSRPELSAPSPRRMMRENASMTRKPRREGLAISSRQLLVPRSSAPYITGTAARAGAPASVLPSAATRPSAGAFECARAATCVGPPLPPQSPDSLRMELGSREAMAAGRALPLGPFTMLNLSPPEPPRGRRAASVRCVGLMWLIYQAIVRGKAACSGIGPCYGLEPRRKAIDSRASLPCRSMRQAKRP